MANRGDQRTETCIWLRMSEKVRSDEVRCAFFFYGASQNVVSAAAPSVHPSSLQRATVFKTSVHIFYNSIHTHELTSAHSLTHTYFEEPIVLLCCKSRNCSRVCVKLLVQRLFLEFRKRCFCWFAFTPPPPRLRRRAVAAPL